MRSIRIYLCDTSMEGIFSAIYEAWNSKYGHAFIKIQEKGEMENFELFSEYISVEINDEYAQKVAKAIREKISEEAYLYVCYSAMSGVRGRADAIYRFLLLGFSVGKEIQHYLSHPYVQPIFEMERNVNNEYMHYKGFLRFTELENAILFARIRPQNHIITLLAYHFADRLPEENWMIYDEGRKTAVVHRASMQWFLTDAAELDKEIIENFSKKELEMQKIWKHFVSSIGIKERKNIDLQTQMLPKRFREFMNEFQ